MRRIKERRPAIEWVTYDRIGAEYMLSKPRPLGAYYDPNYAPNAKKQTAQTDAPPTSIETVEFFSRIDEKVSLYAAACALVLLPALLRLPPHPARLSWRFCALGDATGM